MTIKIGQFEIGAGRAFVIAEIGNNHNGSFDRAIKRSAAGSHPWGGGGGGPGGAAGGGSPPPPRAWGEGEG